MKFVGSVELASSRAKSAFLLTAALISLASKALADEEGIAGHSDAEYHLDKVVVESSALQDTLFNSAQSVSVLSGLDLAEKARNSLGDTLAMEPGVTSSNFGPGAGRPVIRGIGGDRIRVLENGVGTQDVANVSPDHPTTVEASLVDRIEIVRGPASLLYGTSAVGGVVNVFDKRIAEKMVDGPISGTAEVRGESVDRSRAGVLSLDAPAGPFVFHFDGFARRSDDVDIPGFARTGRLRAEQPVEEYPEPRGSIPFTDTDTNNITLGSSYIFDKSDIGDGFLGAAVSEYNTNYGVPNGEPDISVDAKRQRLDVRGGVRNTGAFVDSLITRIGVVDYDHTEFEGSEAGTKFSQNGFDGRIDLTHRELSKVRGAWGVQLQDSSFEAIGEEAFQPPTDSTTYSLFGLEEVFLSDVLTWQLGGRFDWSDLSTAGFEDGGGDDLNVDFNTFSQSTGLVWDVASDYALALSVAHTERAPTGQELFANGPHVATGAFEIGDTDLDIERSLGTDITLRKKEGFVRGSVGAFYNRFWDFISLNPTGAEEDDLPVYQFEAVNADFVGFESQVAMFLVDRPGEEVSFDIQPDYVWAKDRDNDEHLPRIPPFRLKLGATYDNRDLARVRVELQQVFAQNNTASYETSTDGYTMLNIYLSKELPSIADNFEVFVRGSNLLSEKARNHVSFIKDVAPLPGASAMAGFRVRF
ncbi:MAG: TonB-dependent receptor [Pseudomonadota bacterium]|jgi:iron complex outermembrane receptor protein